MSSTRNLYKITLKSLIMLSIPTMLEEVMNTLLQYVDTAMVGHLGEQATAAVSTTTTVTWLVSSIPASFGVAYLSRIAHAVGERNQEKTEKLAQQAFLWSVASGAFVMVLSLLLAPRIPVWMGADVSIRGNASLYFSIVSLPMIFRSMNWIFGSAIRATKDTRTPMLINLSANIMNVVLNAFMIYGIHLGVKGAAIASAISYTFSGIMMFRCLLRNQWLGGWRKIPKVDLTLQKECFRIAIPALGTSVASCLGYVFFAGMVSGMGTTIFAAHSIAVTAETIFYIPGYGLRTATSALIGNALGEKNFKKLDMTEKLSIILTIAMMFLNGVLLYFIAYPLMCLFTSSANVAQLGASMLKLVAFTEPFFGLMIVIEGIFYGMGRTKSIFVIETFSMWCVRILFTFLCVKVWGLDLRAVWYCMIADNILKAVALAVTWLLYKKKQVLEMESVVRG